MDRGGHPLTLVLPPAGRLLVRLPNPLGDAVLATPALRALRAALPGRHITWAGGRAVLEALEGLPDRDAVMPVVGPFAKGLLAPFCAGRMWRGTRPDAVLLLPHAPSAAIAAWRSGASVRVGSGRGLARPFVTERVALPLEGRRPRPRSMTATYLDLARPFGAVPDGRPPALVPTEHDRWRAARRLADVPRGARILAVSPGASFAPTKRMAPERLGGVVARVRERTGLLPLVLAGPGEGPLADAIARAAGPPVVSTAGAPPDVGELKGLLLRSAVCLASDAGPRHVAEALGVPTVVYLGPTDPRWTEGSRATVVRNESLSCLGCHLRRCPIGHPCLDDLDPETLVEAVVRALAPPGPGEG